MKQSLFDLVGIKPNGNNINEIFTNSELNWEVDQYDLRTDIGDVNDYVANYRRDTGQLLGIVTRDKYKVVQNINAFDFIDRLPNFNIEKVGMFNGGKKIFVVGKLDDNFCIQENSDDEVDMYLTFIHGHDGKSAIQTILCPIRMFCTNQLNLMSKTAEFKHSMSHTGDIDTKLKDVVGILAKHYHYKDFLQKEISRLINTKFTDDISNFINLLIPISEFDGTKVINAKTAMQNSIAQLYNDKDDLQNYKGTHFGVLNAVADYVSHMTPRRQANEFSNNNFFISNLENNTILNRAREILATM